MPTCWKNIPLPEGHLIPLLLGIIAGESIPMPLDVIIWIRYALGIVLAMVGIFVVIWSVREAGVVELSAPTKLITAGPYAFSRNPMYLAWHLIYGGAIFLVDTRWLLLLFTFVLAYTHYRVILPEEENLEGLFGETYRSYRERVRRYI